MSSDLSSTMNNSSSASGQVPPEASFAPLEGILQAADIMVGVGILQTRDEVIRNIVGPAMQAPMEEVMAEEWIPTIDAVLEANLARLIDEVVRDELPQMVSNAIDAALGEAGRIVLPQLARNEYTCALPCNCETGCPGTTADSADDDDDQ